MGTTLALSLGHNSSAVLIQDGKILGGYEEERFSQEKADSSFPIQSINALRKLFHMPSNTNVCVSHWFIDGTLPLQNKYWSEQTIRHLFPDGRIYSMGPGFTHHDAHAKSAQVFAGEDFSNEYHLLVMDGFGTMGECISIYRVHNNGKPMLIDRIYGFKNSLGMFYQYATAFCGMKMHNHEYKMLAYETRITNTLVSIPDLNSYIDDFSERCMKELLRGFIDKKTDPMTSLDALLSVQQWVNSVLQGYLEVFGFDQAETVLKRILVSYFAQRHVENIVGWIVDRIRPTNLLLVGGLFYNVKINHILGSKVSGKICVMPLAGDQGAAIGVHQHYFGDLEWPNHLFWGHRDLDYVALHRPQDGLYVLNNGDAFAKAVDTIYKDGFVNLVRGSIEYGPRALCNTSTLAKPRLEVGEKVNQMNARTNEMPFALVTTQQQASQMFKDIHKVHKSLEYMIMAREFQDGMHEDVLGGAHYYPLSNTFTCRPQITDEEFMVELLHEFGPLINTSWNYHGVPIVMNTDQVQYTHYKECAELPEGCVTTIIVKE